MQSLCSDKGVIVNPLTLTKLMLEKMGLNEKEVHQILKLKKVITD